MQETSLNEGGALNSFGQNFDFEGNDINTSIKSSYSMLGTSLDKLIEESIIKPPKYMKIDVDGAEHLILKGAQKLLANNELKSVLVEVNENFKVQAKEIIEIMKKYGFKLKEKKQVEENVIGGVFEKSYNYIYFR